MMQKYKTVSELIEELEEDKKAQVETLRVVIKDVKPSLVEHIKWNAPSYQLDGEDRITFNLMNKAGVVKLVLHMGATRKEDRKAEPIMSDNSGLLEWNSDIRATITFNDIDHIKEKRSDLVAILKKWLTLN